MAKPSKQHVEYWQKRIDEILRHIDRTDIDVFKELANIYSKYAKEIQAEIFKFYGKYAEDEGISIQEARKRLRGEDLSDYRENAKKYFEEAEDNPELLKRLNEQYRSSQVTRLEALYLDLEYQLGTLNGSLQVTFEQYLAQTAQYAYRKIMGGRSASTLNRPALKEVMERPWNGYNYSESLWGNTDNLAKDLRDTLEKGFIRGLGPREMANGIRKKYEVAQHRAETLVRTDGTHVITSATAKRYRDAGLKYYRDYVKMDERTTDICKTIHRKNERKLLSEMEPGINAAPYHYNCRTGVIPDEEELMAEDY